MNYIGFNGIPVEMPSLLTFFLWTLLIQNPQKQRLNDGEDQQVDRKILSLQWRQCHRRWAGSIQLTFPASLCDTNKPLRVDHLLILAMKSRCLTRPFFWNNAFFFLALEGAVFLRLQKSWVLKAGDWWWRTGSVIKSTCSCRGPEFSSQDSHGGSQPSVAPRALTPSSALCRHQVWNGPHTYMQAKRSLSVLYSP